jgi:simple sugar transport system ATP-binding protein
MNNISKNFGGFSALKDVQLKVQKGTIHALLGENGAGKSTLMNILYGIYNADGGEIFINGKKAAIKDPNDAIKLGIGMVHQHFMLVGTMTVLENIMLGVEKTKALGILDKNKVRAEIKSLSEKYGLYLDTDALVQDISVGMQQRVEILKTLYRQSDIIILDEPTAVLTPQEIEELITIMHNLIKDNKTIIIITHKLKEIKQSAEFCTIIRRGKYIDTIVVEGVTETELANKMVGREVSLHVEKGPCNPGEVVFEIDKLTVKDNRGIERVKGLSLNVKKGEILGVAGIDGNGQKELIEAITNLTRAESGSIKISGKEISGTTPKNTITSGISTIHEDRHKRGLVLDYSVEDNFVLEIYQDEKFSQNGILNERNINSHASSLIKKFDIRPDNCEKMLARGLSGGNQQKLIIAREVYNSPELLIAVQPTRGLDVGAIEFVHKSLIAQRDSGKAVMLVSFELDEILDISDRVSVIYDGKIVKTLVNGSSVNENILGLLMAGGELDEG